MSNSDYYRKYPERHKEMVKRYREKNKELMRKWSRDSYHRRKSDPANIKTYLLKYAKARAVHKGIEFTITEDDLTLPELCPILQLPLSKDSRRYGYSIDRIDPSRGYTSDNIWIISQVANAMKWDSSKEERLAFAKWVLAGEGGH